MGLGKILGGLADDVRESRERKREQKQREQELADEHEDLVNALLDKFEIPDLDKFVMAYLNKRPEPDEDGGGGKPAPPGRKDYTEFIWKHIEEEEISYEQLKDFAIKNRVVAPSFFGGAEPAEDTSGAQFHSLISTIQDEFEPERIDSEEHLQSQLAVFLKAKYPGRRIDREVTTKFGDKIDILVDGSYAFELKVPESRTTLRNMGAQLEEYREQYPNLCAVIYDDTERGLSQTINDYSDSYKRKYGIRTIVIRGTKGQRPR